MTRVCQAYLGWAVFAASLLGLIGYLSLRCRDEAQPPAAVEASEPSPAPVQTEGPSAADPEPLWLMPHPSVQAPREVISEGKRREIAWERVQPHLKEASKASAQAADKHLKRVQEFFAERKKRTRAFAESVLSLRGKWEVLKSKVPSADAEGHRKFLRERFEETVFSQKEMEELLQAVVGGFVQELRGIENNLLVKIRADLADDELPELLADKRFRMDDLLRQECEHALQGTDGIAERDFDAELVRQAALWGGADVVAVTSVAIAKTVAERLGISAGILAAGAGSTAVTLGVGVVAAFLIDAFLDRYLVSLGYDPKRSVREYTDYSLNCLQEILLKGETRLQFVDFGGGSITFVLPEVPDDDPFDLMKMPPPPKKCLQTELKAIRETREHLRNAALKSLFLKGEKP